MNAVPALAVALLLVPCTAGAQRATSPADAAVFIRLVGSVHAEIDEAGYKRAVDVDHVEIGAGSGFVISPDGYLLTNDHVVSNSEGFLTGGMQRVRFTLRVTGIDVCFRAEAAAAAGLVSPCSPASVTASDPSVDLAVLFVNAPNLPYIALGDSAVVTSEGKGFEKLSRKGSLGFENRLMCAPSVSF